MAIESGDEVTFEYIGRLTDGTVFDTSRADVAADEGIEDENPQREFEPLTVEAGAGTVIEGLDDSLIGMDVGDRETFTYDPEQAYGQPSEENVVDQPRDHIEQSLAGHDAEVGLRIQTAQGAVGEITAVDEDTVTLDFNHELAGETLEFDVEIVDVN